MAEQSMRVIVGTILLIGFVCVCLKKMVDAINGYYADKQRHTDRTRKLLDHGILKKVK